MAGKPARSRLVESTEDEQDLSLLGFCVFWTIAAFVSTHRVVTSAFNNTSSHGGPIREGLPVRVTYSRNAILKLEILEARNCRIG